MQKKETRRMTRKSFVRTLGLSSLGIGAALSACREDAASSARAGTDTGKKYRWNMVTTWPPNLPILSEGCHIFAQWVEEMSAGQLSIRVYGAGELIPAFESFEAVSTNTADIGSGVAYYWAGKTKAAQFFGAIPFGFNAQQMNTWLMCGGGIELWEEVYAPFNLLPMAAGSTGVQMGGWFNREINTLNDLHGLKMRIPGLGGKVLERAGGTVQLSAGDEIYTNLERGVIDATEWIGPFHDYIMGFHQIAKYYYYPGWHEPGPILEIFVNKTSFERLPVHLQAIIRSAAARLNVWTLCQFEAKNAEYLEKIKTETNVQIRSFPDEVMRALRKISEEVMQEMTASDPLSKRVYDSFLAFKQRMRGWSDISERMFYNVISSPE